MAYGKRVRLSLILLGALAAGAAFGQNPAGTWQGSVHASDGDRREVVKISEDGTTLRALVFSIDAAPGQSFPSAPFTLQGDSIKLEFPGMGATYTGTLSSDGNSITGTWVRGQTSLPLNLQRATRQTAWDLPASPPRPKAIAADADPAFALATIKLSSPSPRGFGMGPSPGGRRFTARNASLRDLIDFAYYIHPAQIVGAPAWIETEKYDLTAENDGDGVPSMQQTQTMMRKLIADRFHLKVHREMKEMSVYMLSAGKPPLKLIPSTGDAGEEPTVAVDAGDLHCRNTSTGDFSAMLQSVILDRPVLDRTGLSGRFDFALTWRADEFQAAQPGLRQVPDDNDTRPDFFTAIQQQLGLKLEAKKASVEMLVVDGVEHPSPN